jgi:hypothetical protein
LIALLFLTKRIMSFLRPMLKNRCTFNELEFRRMEQFDAIFKKAIPQQPQQILLTLSCIKTTTKNEDQFFGVLRK